MITPVRDKSLWDWTLLMTIPDWITQDMAASAIGEVGEKHRRARLGDIRLTTLSEGRCVHPWSGPSRGTPGHRPWRHEIPPVRFQVG